VFAGLRIEQLALPAVRLGPEAPWPILDDAGAHRLSRQQAELLGGPGVERHPTVLPYGSQDDYSREIAQTSTEVAVLDNGQLRATFLLDWGGRLWSLTDLASGRELLHQPDSLQLGNLALRNAWFAGGVEWNLGFTGHWGLTCSSVCAGRLDAPDGSPVLRLWAFERMLRLVWRIDCWLDGDSLYVRPLLHNPWSRTVPIYWWSNVAVPLDAGTRVLTDAGRAWTFDSSRNLELCAFPGDEFDQSFPDRYDFSADRFLEARGEHPWIAAVDAAGTGLGQSSGPLLRGRKLFTWGSGRGGQRWQRWLSGTGRYAEIQSGLARTQFEHLPLAPGERWAWTESYRPVDVGASATLPWSMAVNTAREAVVDRRLELADATLALIEQEPVEVLRANDGWGALEVVAGHLATSLATPFPAEALSDDQRPWVDVLATGTVPGPARAVTGVRWASRLHGDGPHDHLHRGYLALSVGNYSGAEECFRAAGSLPEALRALARLARGEQRAACYERALAAGGESGQLRTEAASAFADLGRWQRVLELTEGESQGRLGVLRCRALIGLGRLDEARGLIEQPLVLPDLREGDNPLASLWAAFAAAVGTQLPTPEHYDFSMRQDC